MQDGQSRTIRQFQFTDWPEQGVPKMGEGFIDFIGQVHKTKEQFGQDGPITVHCRYRPPVQISIRRSCIWTTKTVRQSSLCLSLFVNLSNLSLLFIFLLVFLHGVASFVAAC